MLAYRPLRYEQMMQAAEAFDVRARRMFGGMGIYTGDKMFAFLLEDEVGFKLCPEHICEALDLPGAGPMYAAEQQTPMREYVKMPREVLNDREKFTLWLERSAGYAREKALQAA